MKFNELEKTLSGYSFRFFDGRHYQRVDFSKWEIEKNGLLDSQIEFFGEKLSQLAHSMALVKNGEMR